MSYESYNIDDYYTTSYYDSYDYNHSHSHSQSHYLDCQDDAANIDESLSPDDRYDDLYFNICYKLYKDLEQYLLSIGTPLLLFCNFQNIYQLFKQGHILNQNYESCVKNRKPLNNWYLQNQYDLKDMYYNIKNTYNYHNIPFNQNMNGFVDYLYDLKVSSN